MDSPENKQIDTPPPAPKPLYLITTYANGYGCYTAVQGRVVGRFSSSARTKAIDTAFMLQEAFRAVGIETEVYSVGWVHKRMPIPYEAQRKMASFGIPIYSLSYENEVKNIKYNKGDSTY